MQHQSSRSRPRSTTQKEGGKRGESSTTHKGEGRLEYHPKRMRRKTAPEGRRPSSTTQKKEKGEGKEAAPTQGKKPKATPPPYFSLPYFTLNLIQLGLVFFWLHHLIQIQQRGRTATPPKRGRDQRAQQTKKRGQEAKTNRR